MKTTSNNAALAALIVAAGLAVGVARVRRNDADAVKDAPAFWEGRDLCVGVEKRGSAIGLVCAAGPDRIAAEAAKRLDLPDQCSEATANEKIFNGDLISFSLADGRCSIEKAERSPGNVRLLCGVGIDVNRDEAKDIELLPGIGEVKAKAIVESRIENGPFNNRDDLLRVRGIGPKTLDLIVPWLEWPDKAGRAEKLDVDPRRD